MKDLIKDIHEKVKQARLERFKQSDQLSLGGLINLIEDIDLTDRENEPSVYFDFCSQYPTGLDSWRGIYAELALNHVQYGEGSEPMEVSEFLKMLKEADGKTFEGYKGGDFTMDRDTPVWVANYSHAGCTAVIGVIDVGYQVIICTGYRES